MNNCDYNQERKIICENENHIAFTNRSPISKAASLVVTKTHSLLPIAKDAISRISKVYQPIGYLLYICAGDEKKHELLPGEHREKAYQESVKRLNANSEGVIRENDKAIARLFPKDEARCQAHIIIKPKKSIPNDTQIQKVDQET
ncbi:20635_t:CDS:2 [Entrophospora sp. SA101]|nr:20635_t:CDS:2 [Entrophospora sp. SA101]